MMKQGVGKARHFFSGVRVGKWAMVAIVLAGFLAGYNGTSSYVRSCNAQIPQPGAPSVTGGTCVCCKGCFSPCDPAGTANALATMLINALDANLVTSSIVVENFVAITVDTMVQAILDRLNVLEMDLISWWQTMWHYNLKPAMQQMTRQINVATTDQSRSFQGTIDSVEESQTLVQYQDAEIDDHRAFRPGEQTCIGGTNAGGFGRATEFSKGVRKAMARTPRERGLNKKGTPSASGMAAAEKTRHDEYEAIFCDPNGGLNPCAGDPNYYNADTQVTRQIYNNLTINMDDDVKVQKTVEALLDNMTGSASSEPIQLSAFNSSAGRETFIQRRSYLARNAAARSVPQLIVGWRTPGSNMGTWVSQLRKDAGIPNAAISDNPSYREIVHAVTVDRFNSGKYANVMIASQNEIEMEKLMLSAFYLMQLRDYYELLERQALALAVQVSILAEKVPMPAINTPRPMK